VDLKLKIKLEKYASVTQNTQQIKNKIWNHAFIQIKINFSHFCFDNTRFLKNLCICEKSHLQTREIKSDKDPERRLTQLVYRGPCLRAPGDLWWMEGPTKTTSLSWCNESHDLSCPPIQFSPVNLSQHMRQCCSLAWLMSRLALLNNENYIIILAATAAVVG